MKFIPFRHSYRYRSTRAAFRRFGYPGGWYWTGRSHGSDNGDEF
jgi:hypothetical protein